MVMFFHKHREVYLCMHIIHNYACFNKHGTVVGSLFKTVHYSCLWKGKNLNAMKMKWCRSSPEESPNSKKRDKYQQFSYVKYALEKA